MKNHKLRKILIWIGVILLIIVLIGAKMGWFKKNLGQKVSIDKVKKREIVEIVSANGKIQPENEVKISPDVSGEVTELYVHEGDSVHKNELLAKIKPDMYQAALDRVAAALNTSMANLSSMKSKLLQIQSEFDRAEAAYNRNKKLHDVSAISESEYETALSTYKVAKANVEALKQDVSAAEFNVKSAEASKKEATDNLSKTTLFSPVNGIVSKLKIEKGERVVGTSQMAGTEMMIISNLNDMEVNADVSENDIVRVKRGDTAVIEVDAFTARKFKGVVSEVASSANVAGTGTDQVTNFAVKIRILKESYQDLIKENISPFRPGMSATVDIRTKKAVDVLSVPIQAVTTRDLKNNKNEMDKRVQGNDENESVKKVKTEVINECVFTIVNGRAKQKTVKTGIQDNQYIEIISGLNLNEDVIDGPYSAVSRLLKDSDLVEVVDKDKLFEIKDIK